MKLKRILFLHPNMPGQFKTIAAIAGKMKNIEVKFVCMTNYHNTPKGVESLIIKGERGQKSMEQANLDEFKKMEFRAESYRRAFKSLKGSGWNPDIVIGHTGWGCGLYVKEMWPICLFIGYMEWWFNIDSAILKSAESSPFLGITKNSQQETWKRNQFIALELSIADKIISPTKWQRSQLPKSLQQRCLILHDGLDLDFFSNRVVKPEKHPLITYGTRGMEPMRCFKEFIESIPEVIRRFPDALIEIAGEDKICYGGKKPAPGTTWGEWAKDYLKSAGLEEKVLWNGRMDYKKYREWLQRSWCHVYLSQPFIASWSFLDALACNIPVVASRTLPVEEYSSKVSGVYLVDHSKNSEISENICSVIEQTNTNAPLWSRYSRSASLDYLSIRNTVQAWEHVTGLVLHT